jgi:hypothetical protein
MSKAFPIGTYHREEEKRERKLLLDPGQLIKTRMLVTANSGGGKSYLLRVLLEQLGRTTPIIVIDREGDFVTLGEKLDVVQVGPHGDIPADVRSAGMLCRRLLEKRLSAVIDLSELVVDRNNPDKRRRTVLGVQRWYVRNFMEELVGLPKKFWRPTFIVLDESHLFAPEKGHGEAESSDAVIDAATLGRKRAYCTIFATQRIAKFHKDAAAEMQNRFFGAITLDNDVERAAKDLGMTTKAATPILRALKPGEFFAFGPALSERGVVRFHGAAALTTHPEPGQGRTLKPPKPSRAIAAVLSDFTDLPEEAEAEIREMSQAKSRIAELERDLRQRPKEQVTREHTVEVPSKRDAATIARLRNALEEAMQMIDRLSKQELAVLQLDAARVQKIVESAVAEIVKQAGQAESKRQAEYKKLLGEAEKVHSRMKALVAVTAPAGGDSNGSRAAATPAKSTVRHTPRIAIDDDAGDGDDGGGGDGEDDAKDGMRRILIALAENRDGVGKRKLGILARLKPDGSTLRGNLAKGRREGWIEDDEVDGQAVLKITRAGLGELGSDYKPLPAPGPELVDYWRRRLGSTGAAGACFNVMVKRYPDAVPDKHHLAESANVVAGGSTMRGALTKLRALGLIEKNRLRASDELFG